MFCLQDQSFQSLSFGIHGNLRVNPSHISWETFICEYSFILLKNDNCNTLLLKSKAFQEGGKRKNRSGKLGFHYWWVFSPRKRESKMKIRTICNVHISKWESYSFFTRDSHCSLSNSERNWLSFCSNWTVVPLACSTQRRKMGTKKTELTERWIGSLIKRLRKGIWSERMKENL